MFADGDAVAMANEFVEIVIHRMNRYAAHGNVFAQIFAAFGEGNTQGRRRLNRVIEKQLVEIAHAIEKQDTLMGSLQLLILRHHGGHEGCHLVSNIHGSDVAELARE